jgi:hypothetical protein
VAATWSITRADQVASCAQVGAASVSLDFHNPTSGEDVTSAFPCMDGQGMTTLVTGTYDAVLTLRTADGVALATTPTLAVTVGEHTVIRLPPVPFVVDGRDALTRPLTTPATARATTRATTSHGPPAAQGGTAMTTTALTVEHAAKGCAAVTFSRSRGGRPVATSTINGSAPNLVRCLERDAMRSVDGIDPGPSAIQGIGSVGSVPRGAAVATLSVPGRATLAPPAALAPPVELTYNPSPLG